MIVLRAKQIPFEVTYIDLTDKPDWFLEISPHGKVPVLKVDDEILFESNAIAEFLDEQVPPQLHPADPFKRARNRAWTDFVPDFSKAINAIGYAKTREAMEEGVANAPKALSRLERALATERGNDGPYFNGPDLCLVDAAYAPFFQRFQIVEQWLATGLLESYPLVSAWADALAASPAVANSVPDVFYDEFVANLKRRGFHVATLMASSTS